jgi:hypothetical protein
MSLRYQRVELDLTGRVQQVTKKTDLSGAIELNIGLS